MIFENTPAERQFRYFLSSDRIGFRLWKEDDLQLALRLWGDPEVTRFFANIPLTEKQVTDRLHTEIAREQQYGVQYWPIFLRGSNDFLGCCGLRPYRAPDRVYELGIHLVPEVWGHGYATEGADAVIAYAFKDLVVNGIFAGHHPENVGSKKVLLNCGFVETGADYYEPTGLMHPSYMLKNG